MKQSDTELTQQPHRATHRDDDDLEPDAHQNPLRDDLSGTTAEHVALDPRRLGEFRLLRRLGRGGMAEVYLAEQTTLKRQVAVKVLRPELISGSDDTVLLRFEQEATAAAGLSHPNIVQVYLIGEDGGVHFIAQEYVQGLNLRDYLKREGPPDWPAAVGIMRQVASALDAAAEAGIVHRDVKPENIMITPKGQVKVADFGLAQLTTQGERLNLTQIGMTMGTPLYMSPEQINGQRVDHRSDIYSFGVTCYHMLAGRPPFEGPTAMSVAALHLKGEPAPLAEVRADLPPALCRIVHKMMAKSPADRYPNAQAVLEEINAFMVAVGDKVSAAEFHPAMLNRRRGSRRLSRMLRSSALGQIGAFLAACLVLGAVAAALGAWLRPDNPLQSTPIASPRIPTEKTALDQYWLALSLVDDEEAWKAVKNHPDDEPLLKRLASEQLGLYYVRSKRYDEAREEFDKLITQAGNDPAARVKPHIGLAMVHTLEGRYSESQQIIETQVYPNRQHLDSEDQLRVLRMVRRNREHLETVDDSLNELLNEPPEESDERI
ncbi:MAG: protein kinase domain-containing protein [Planctomycetaceae bacterium]